jgi:hypothetical protein
MDEATHAALAKAGYRLHPGRIEAKAGTGPAENKAAAGPAENKGQLPDGVKFGSAAAERMAIDEGVTLERLRAAKPTGATGFTVADIRKLAAE